MLDSPTESAPIENAVQWIESTLLGTLATTLAVIAVAALGVLMLTGRVDWRRGATTILGCFMIFGARGIASSLQALAPSSPNSGELLYAVEPPAPPPKMVPTSPPSTPPQRPEVQL